MKRRVYFIISSICGIVLSIYTMFNASEVVKKEIESINSLGSSINEQLKQRMINMLQSSGNKTIIFSSILIIVLNLIIVYFVKNKSLFKNKGISIVILLFCMLLAQTNLEFFIYITSIVIMVFSKKEKLTEKEKKKKIEKLKEKILTRKDILLSILLLTVYFSQFAWNKFIPGDRTIRLLILIFFDIIMLTLCILVFFDELKNGIIAFKNNFKQYIKFVFSKLGIGYLIYIFAMVIALKITSIDTTVNQKTVESLPKLYILPLAIIWAPIVEETLFRGVFRRFIKNNFFYIISSGLIFGLLHTVNEPNLLNMFVLAIPYGVIGSTLAYMYVKSNNILTNISSHAFFNTIAAIITIL